MERPPTLEEAEGILGIDFLGPAQLQPFFDVLGSRPVYNSIPPIPYSIEKLKSVESRYILLLGVPQMADQAKINISLIRSHVGVDPELSEPCFYNQDWYLNEEFINKTLDSRWYLIKKDAISDSRAKTPDSFLQENSTQEFPSAILCTVCFFAYYFHTNGDILWKHDFIWCNDKDHNGDRIYIGKYNDIAGVNKNGFSIHRHLSLRDYHAAIFSE